MRLFSFRRVGRTPLRMAGVLARLRSDVRGNVLAMMAVWMMPLAAFSGSAIDMGRLYAVKVRLQQACDAGVLAGRKSMTDATLDTSASGQAQTFFKANFNEGWFNTRQVSFTPTRTDDSQVSGVASAAVPMTLMAVLGQSEKTVRVTCQARYDVADADIMFVLDTTGSMACTPTASCSPSEVSYTRPDGTTGYYSVEVNGSKLSGLRTAVLSFYDTLAASADDTTHIRYGFVPYTSTVNVGYALYAASPSYLVTQWQYQTRHAVGDKVSTTNSTSTVSASSETNCLAKESRTPALVTTKRGDGTSYTTYTYNKNGTATFVDASWGKDDNNKNVCTLKNQTVIPIWRYEQWPYDVSGFIKGDWIADPSKVTDGGASTQFYKAKWQGCIEERNTTASASFSQGSLPPDLDPDLAPTASVDANGFPTSSDTRWRPMWPDVVYYRNTTPASVDYTGDDNNPYGDTSSDAVLGVYTSVAAAQNQSAGYTTCGKPVQRLKVMSRDDVSNYVNASDFKAIGGTYHDTGMIWGTRLISPSGLFAGDTSAWSGHQAPNRYIVFMTDGDMAPNPWLYGMYGIESLDKRVTGGTTSNQTSYHNARFTTECAAAKARNITVFVVGFGQTLTSEMKTCASPGQAYYASDNDALKAAFQKIAQQVAMLRISK